MHLLRAKGVGPVNIIKCFIHLPAIFQLGSALWRDHATAFRDRGTAPTLYSRVILGCRTMHLRALFLGESQLRWRQSFCYLSNFVSG